MTKQKQSSDTDTDTQRTSRRGVTTVITLTLVVGVVLAASISPLGVVAAATEFSVTTTAPETVSPDETIDISYTIENTGDTALESLALTGTPQTSDTELTITDAASDSAAAITEDNRIIFETVAPGASVTATLTVAVGTDATGTESLTANTTNGFDQNEVSKQTVTELTVTTENTPPTADAGTDQTVDEESQLTLDGTGSSDPDDDSLSYRWTQTGGPSVSLQDSATPTPEFTAPSVTSDTTLTFELTVTDGNGGQDTDTVAIGVEPQDNETTQTTVTVKLDSVPAGLQRFNVSVAGPSGSSITTVNAGVISGGSFEIFSGGEGDSTVTARGVDLAESVGQSSDPVRLYEAEFEFADTVERSDLTVTVTDLTNDNGAAMSENLLTVTTSAAPETENPVIGDNQAPATDPDGDGQLEDVNGDGEATFDDAIGLAFNTADASVQQNRESFDFDGDGDVDFDDAISLAFAV